MQLASFSTPSTRGVWINHLYLVCTEDNSMTDHAGITPVPIDAFPFRLHVQTVHMTATLAGFLDILTLRQTVEALIDVAFLLLCLGRPPNLTIWTTVAMSAERSVREIQSTTRLIDVANVIVPLTRFNFLVQDPPAAVNRDPARELNAPDIILL